MKTIVLFAILAITAAQIPYGSRPPYGSYGRPTYGNSGIGTGSPIIFPDSPQYYSRPAVGSGFGGIPSYGSGQGFGTGQFFSNVQPGGSPGFSGVNPGSTLGFTGLQPSGFQSSGSAQPSGVQNTGFNPNGIQNPASIQGANLQTSGRCVPTQTVHANYQGSDYYFSWCVDGGQKYEWHDANQICSRLGPGWYGISIDDNLENTFVIQTIASHNLDYIWTGGQRSGTGWAWTSGKPFIPLDWSHTGGLGRPQPDNQEDNIENCLAVLNNVYQDGIKWHDVACYHPKPIICERSLAIG
ncbi:C-type lectin (CTL) or carbohydrate-recognition domain (CRD) [Halocaridina rubra]|uniref:C-type lectin (CTL) or carbohydrate-recognition domain (CRD) n=1 Tax=Halocaridina rubra TaxID=373956 RepID=A0AAN9AB27_HALRR